VVTIHPSLKALTCYEGAIAIRPDFAIAHGNMGSCQFDLGNVDAAIKTFKHAIQLEVIGCFCVTYIFTYIYCVMCVFFFSRSPYDGIADICESRKHLLLIFISSHTHTHEYSRISQMPTITWAMHFNPKVQIF
jgi:hypothetical protein